MNGNHFSQWMIEAKPVFDALDTHPEAKKMKATIRALAYAHATGQPKNTVFQRSTTCSQTIYYEKWRKNELFAEAETRVIDLVDTYMEEAELEAIRQAVHIQRMAAVKAAKTQVELLDASQAVFSKGEYVGQQDDNATRRIVAKNILDAASASTAEKKALPEEEEEPTTAYNAERLAKLSAKANEQLEQWERERTNGNSSS